MNLDDVNIDQYNSAYFLGIGGIGMSALARYFNNKGWIVGGYDKTPSSLTEELVHEGIQVHFDDLRNEIPESFNSKDKTLVIVTPAIPKNLGELEYVLNNEFLVLKRSQVLGLITRDSIALGVAGTHGKTTTSTMLAYILSRSKLKCNAFLGGISSNFNSNFVSDPESVYTVIEADEFDRSFLQLRPYASIITSTDADHLDIYGNNDVFLEGFKDYAQLIDTNGFLIRQASVELSANNTITYAVNERADYQGINLRFIGGYFTMDVVSPEGVWENIELGVPGIHNAENAIACIAMARQLKIDIETIREALKSFSGVKRRFEYHIRTDKRVFIDDYAHHPTEIKALVSSVRMLYPDKKITGVFQPHLYSRTRDFFEGFVNELNKLDEVILLPIYAAREEPIVGVSSIELLNKISVPVKVLMDPSEVVSYVSNINVEVLLTIGAGDIDRIVPSIKKALQT